jgi:hypothetical protein
MAASSGWEGLPQLGKRNKKDPRTDNHAFMLISSTNANCDVCGIDSSTLSMVGPRIESLFPGRVFKLDISGCCIQLDACKVSIVRDS